MQIKKESKMKEYRCSNCSSENVNSHDAIVQWNKEKQIWLVVRAFNRGGVCEDCNHDCSLIESEEK